MLDNSSVSYQWEAGLRKEIIGHCELYLGDCRDILPTLGKMDAILTDPPFGINYRSGHRTSDLWSSDHIYGDQSISLRDGILAQFTSIPCLVFGSWKADRPPGTRMVLTWDKGPALGMGALDLPWKPSSEEIYVLGKGFVGKRDEEAVIYCPPVQSMACNGRQHPNEKPVRLLSKLMAKLPAGTILDPFMGSGSTGMACIEKRNKFIGIEIDERYFDIACRRIEKSTRQPDLFIKREKVVQGTLSI
jgi:DNA modification methylase